MRILREQGVGSMTYILPHTNGGWAHAKELLGGVARPLVIALTFVLI